MRELVQHDKDNKAKVRDLEAEIEERRKQTVRPQSTASGWLPTVTAVLLYPPRIAGCCTTVTRISLSCASPTSTQLTLVICGCSRPRCAHAVTPSPPTIVNC